MSALVHERTPLLCALGGAAAGERHGVCQSDGSPGARRERGGVERGRQVRSHKTREPTGSTLPKFAFAFGKKNSTTLQFPGPSQTWGLPTRRGHGYGPSLEGLRKELGSTSRHWAHRDQTWTSCAFFLQAREVTSSSLWHTEPVGYYEMAPGTVFKCTVGIRALRCTWLSSELDAPGKTYWQANMYNGKMRRNRLCIGQKRFFFFPLTAVNRQSNWPKPYLQNKLHNHWRTHWENNKFHNNWMILWFVTTSLSFLICRIYDPEHNKIPSLFLFQLKHIFGNCFLLLKYLY